MKLKPYMDSMFPAIESELQGVIARLDEPHTRPFYAMLTYHMGWTGEGAGPEATGKRIRPLLILLTSAACGASWQPALPAAACVELIHNFSLAHDDIQDNSDTRRGRMTVWKQWGIPQGINAGDALFILAQIALLELREHFPPETVLQSGQIIHQACLSLCNGQFLDISYQERADLSLEDYWPMVAGKTAALLSACTQVGAVLGGADEARQEAYQNFGHYLGLAFQVKDDYLGVWGDSALLGKSTASDLVEGKKSFPVLYGLEKKGPFAQRWAEGPVRPDEISRLSGQLAEEGVKLHTLETADNLTDLALKCLQQADPQGEAGEALFELTHMLLNRDK